MAIRARSFLGSVNFLGIAVMVGGLAVWQALVSSGLIHPTNLPGPFGIITGFRQLLQLGLLWPAVGHTMMCMSVAWGIAVIIGGGLGLLVGVNKTARDWTSATVDVLRSLPVLAFIPVAILIWGPASKAEIVVAAYAALWPMLINTAGGARNVGPRLRDVARSLCLSRFQRMRKIVLPATGISMLVGARLALAIALVVCVVAEMLGLPNGIGYSIVAEESAGQPDRMWAYIVTIGVLGILTNAGLVLATKLAFPGVSRLAAGDRL